MKKKAPHNVPKVMIFKVRIHEQHSELYDTLLAAGGYYRTKRLIYLAELGLASEQSRLSSGLTQAIERTPPVSVKEKFNPTQKKRKVIADTDSKKHYQIPTSVESQAALSDLFAFLET
jgi:hypothetical protein